MAVADPGDIDTGGSPASRYSAAHRRTVFPALAEFTAGYEFALDRFQRDACEALESGNGVLVCAPTGAGKTVVGEFAVHLALASGQKCFYTTPIKALSNQKYADLVERHGADSVGLLTGDIAVHGDAPIVVMTTEVLRNMLYAGSPALRGLGYVVMDEVHYLADKFRGAVWEEVIIHLPESVRLVSLSATVSNAEEFGEWLVTVRGHTTVIVSEHRPVPLWQHMMVGSQIYDLFSDVATQQIDPELLRVVRDAQRRSEPIPYRSNYRARGRRAGHRPPPRTQRRPRPTDRVTVIERLDAEGLLPAIVFIFSRAGCEAALRRCAASGIRLVGDEQRAEIRAVAEDYTAELSDADLNVLGYWEWLQALECGMAAHHAGLIPAFKQAVELLFARGLVKVVFATETLALGINMPARSVVVERLVKFNGEAHAEVTPGEYTQLTGRAGRRGIDIEGHAVVEWVAGMDPAQVAGLASTRTYPLRSSFRPSYNMAVNLVGQLGRDHARALLERSFAQFQADRSVVALARQIERNDEALVGYAEAMSCHLGDFREYAALRRQITDAERSRARASAAARRAAAAASLEGLRVGDVIRIPGGRRSGVAVVIDPGAGSGMREPAPTVLSIDHRVHRISAVEVTQPVQTLARMRIPQQFNARSPRSRRDLASSLRNLDLPERPAHRDAEPAGDEALASVRATLWAHPCHGCADKEEHARWADRYDRLQRDTAVLRDRAERRTHSLARDFDRICALLSERGYLAVDGESVTDSGRQLSRVWSESDLLVTECLCAGVWSGLDAAGLAAAASALLYESRQSDGRGLRDATRVPGPVREALLEQTRLWSELADSEREHKLAPTREPDPGFARPVYRWARGESLERALGAADELAEQLSAGDFVRWCKQVVDLLDQVAAVAPPQGAARAAEAIAAVRRGVVAAG